MADFGFKSAAPGFDVRTAAANNLVVSSSRNCLKVDNVATTTVTLDATGFNTKTIAHGQAFVPITFVAALIGGSYYFEPYFGIGATSPYVYATVDLTNIVVRVNVPTQPDETINLYYWVSETENAI